MMSISSRIDLYSWLAEVCCAPVRVLFETSVAQRHGTVEQIRHLRESAIGHLQQADALTGVGLRLGQRRLIGLQPHSPGKGWQRRLRRS